MGWNVSSLGSHLMSFGVWQHTLVSNMWVQPVQVIDIRSDSAIGRNSRNPLGLLFRPWLYRCFLKWWYPQNTPKWTSFEGKPMVVGETHHFRKPPYIPTHVAPKFDKSEFFWDKPLWTLGPGSGRDQPLPQEGWSHLYHSWKLKIKLIHEEFICREEGFEKRIPMRQR